MCMNAAIYRYLARVRPYMVMWAWIQPYMGMGTAICGHGYCYMGMGTAIYGHVDMDTIYIHVVIHVNAALYGHIGHSFAWMQPYIVILVIHLHGCSLI